MISFLPVDDRVGIPPQPVLLVDNSLASRTTSGADDNCSGEFVAPVNENKLFSYGVLMQWLANLQTRTVLVGLCRYVSFGSDVLVLVQSYGVCPVMISRLG